MAFTKKTQLPLKQYYNVNKTSIHTVGDKYNYSLHTLNIGSKDGLYDYEGTEFLINLLTFTGYVKGEDKWLLATTSPDENGKTLSLDIKPDWKTVDKEQTNEAVSKWELSNYLIAIDTKDIPVLSMLVESLYKHKILVRGKLKVNLAWDKTTRDTYSSYLDNYFGFVKDNNRMPTKADGDVYSTLGAISQLITVPLPYMNVIGYEPPRIPEIDPELGIPTGNTVFNTVPFVGEFPNIEDFVFSIPTPPIPWTGGGKSGSSVSSAVVEGYKSNEGWEWIQQNYDGVSDFFKKKCPYLSDTSIVQIVLSISGVNSVPSVLGKSSPSLNSTPELEIYNSATSSQVNGASELTLEPEQAKDFVTVVATPIEKTTVEDALEKHFTRNKLKFSAWAKKHTSGDQENILYIFDSMLYLKHKDKVDSWVGDRMGSTSPIPPTALDSTQLKELKDYAEEYQSLSSVDPQIEPNLPE